MFQNNYCMDIWSIYSCPCGIVIKQEWSQQPTGNVKRGGQVDYYLYGSNGNFKLGNIALMRWQMSPGLEHTFKVC